MEEKYEQLISESYSLPRGDTKVAVLEKAVRIADTHLTTEHSFQARMELTDAAIIAGRAEKAILSFAWCLNEYDKHPNQYNSFNMMWQYKWIIAGITDFPEITTKKIKETLEDLRKRFLSLGYNHRVYYKQKMCYYEHIGDFPKMVEYYHKWDQEGRDMISDCNACEVHQKADILLTLERFEEAYQAAQPIFDGTISCRNVPHCTYGIFLLPLLEQNKNEEAAEFHRRGMNLIDGQSGFLDTAIEHLEYLIVVDLDQAISFFEKYLPQALDSLVPNTKYHFYRAAVILFDYLDETNKKTLQMPDHVTPEGIEKELYEIAKKFDLRNQNDKYVNQIHHLKNRIARLKQ